MDYTGNDSNGSGAQTRLAELVDKLPEIYQPIYGHPEFRAIRSWDSRRLDVLTRSIDRIGSLFGRPLRVLDLGTAQGFLAFTIAERGHHVTGIEALEENFAVASALSAEHRSLDVEFISGDAVDCAQLCELDGYDVVVGFAVLHHVAYRDGHPAAVELVSRLSAHVEFGLFETALREEPMYWAEALPEDPRITLSPYPFVRCVGEVQTHLSDVQRPVLFASRTHALVGDELVPIRSYKEDSHSSANPAAKGLRRYFLVPDAIVKVTAQFVEDPDRKLLSDLRQEQRREAFVLHELESRGVDGPRLVEFADGAHESVIARTVSPGMLLSEVAPGLDERGRAIVTGQVLEALAELEEHGLYHADLRLWNVVWDEQDEQAHLIDYGGISSSPEDTMWPHDAYFSLMVFVVSLWAPFADQTGLELPRQSRIEDASLPAPVAVLLSALMTHSRDDRVFRDVAARWREVHAASQPISWPVPPVSWAWLAEAERADSDRRAGALAEGEELRAHRDELVGEIDRLGAEHEQLAATAERLRSELEATEGELERVHASRSWRLTEPLRVLSSLFRRLGGER